MARLLLQLNEAVSNINNICDRLSESCESEDDTIWQSELTEIIVDLRKFIVNIHGKYHDVIRENMDLRR